MNHPQFISMRILFRCLMVFLTITISTQLAHATDEDNSYQIVKTFVRVSSVDAKNPEQFIQNLKKNLVAILKKDKILGDSYPKPCVFKEQADRSTICAVSSSLALDDSSQLLLSIEGWSLSFWSVKFPTSRNFNKEIYLIPESLKANLKSIANGAYENSDKNYSRILVLDGLPTRKFDEALDKAILEAGAAQYSH